MASRRSAPSSPSTTLRTLRKTRVSGQLSGFICQGHFCVPHICSVPHPFAFFLAKGWETTNLRPLTPAESEPHSSVGCPILPTYLILSEGRETANPNRRRPPLPSGSESQMRNGVSQDLIVNRDQNKPFKLGLRHQQAVEWIAMQLRKRSRPLRLLHRDG
jgi:hypothetical protein